MVRLRVKRLDTFTRVTDYVPEIVAFVGRIVQNGYAYEVAGASTTSIQKSLTRTKTILMLNSSRGVKGIRNYLKKLKVDTLFPTLGCRA
jgi:cysteinyl-tRNA synthetase